MKLGDVITVLGPHGPVSGVVLYIDPLKTRPGWTVAIDYSSPRDPHKFIVRPESEGENWIYGCEQKSIDALQVANALGDTTQVSPRTKFSARRGRARGTL